MTSSVNPVFPADPRAIHLEIQVLLAAAAAAAGQVPRLRDLSPTAARAQVEEMASSLDLPPIEIAVVRELLVPTPYGPVRSRLYAIEPHLTGPVVIFIHGGGWVLGSLSMYDSFCRYLAHRVKRRVVAVDYRLAPEHPFPAGYEDCEAVLQWVLSSPHELGQPVPAVAVAGDSAGGNLSAALSGTVRQRIAGQLLLYAVTDISAQSDSYRTRGEGYLLEQADLVYFRDCYVPHGSLRTDSRASPLLASNVLGVPPTVLLTCGWDVLRDEGRAYGAKLITAGVSVHFVEATSYIHGLATMRAAVPSGVALIDECVDEFARILECAS